MQFRPQTHRSLFSGLFLLLVFAAFGTSRMQAQDEEGPKPEQHGRKYKAPPETSHIQVTVLKGFNKKPIDGAHVVFHPVKDGVDEGNLEVKTHQDGKVSIDVIPTGSNVRIQVIADGFAPYAQDYVVPEESREITIEMIRPRAQVSTYVDNSGKPSEIQPGVQVPIRPKKATPSTARPGPNTAPSTAPPVGSTTPSTSKPQ